MYLRDQTDNNILFSNGSSNQSFYLCSSNINFTGTKTIPFDIVGNSSVQYIPSVNSITVNVTVALSPTNPTIVTSSKTNSVNISSNLTGILYYTFSVGNFTTAPKALTEIQAGLVNATNNYSVLESSSDALIHLVGHDKDLRIGSASVNAGQNTTLTFTDLRPNTTYTICSYFTTGGNSSVSSPGASCSSMTTNASTWTIYKTLLVFSANQTETQRNSLLCTFADLIGTNTNDQLKYIINQRSESCNRSG